MTPSPDRQPQVRLRPAIVLASAEDECRVVTEGRAIVVPYAPPFPRPRAERVMPGHLVALAATTGGLDVIVWRWFDAVVVEQAGSAVTLWEPNHGSVAAQSRDLGRDYLPGSRAYLSAGLPGAAWWVAGPAVQRPEDADVELDEVHAFFSAHGLWDRLG